MFEQLLFGFNVEGDFAIDSRFRKATIADRNSIAPAARYEGLFTYVDEDETFYILQGGTTNDDWSPITANEIESVAQQTGLDADEYGITFTLTDGTTFDTGNIRGIQGAGGERGLRGLIQVTLFGNFSATPPAPTAGNYILSTDTLNGIPADWARSNNRTTPTQGEETYTSSFEFLPQDGVDSYQSAFSGVARTGGTGPAGKDATIAIGSVTNVPNNADGTAGNASVTNSGSPTTAIFDFNLPTGPEGRAFHDFIVQYQGADGVTDTTPEAGDSTILTPRTADPDGGNIENETPVTLATGPAGEAPVVSLVSTDNDEGRSIQFSQTLGGVTSNLGSAIQVDDANTILNGQSAPTDSIGNDGDFYINTVTLRIFGPKNESAVSPVTQWGTGRAISQRLQSTDESGDPVTLNTFTNNSLTSVSTAGTIEVISDSSKQDSIDDFSNIVFTRENNTVGTFTIGDRQQIEIPDGPIGTRVIKNISGEARQGRRNADGTYEFANASGTFQSIAMAISGNDPDYELTLPGNYTSTNTGGYTKGTDFGYNADDGTIDIAGHTDIPLGSSGGDDVSITNGTAVVGQYVSGASNIDGAITLARVSLPPQRSDESIQDLVGAMFTNNTETNITVTYDDSDGTIDLVASGGGNQIVHLTSSPQDIPAGGFVIAFNGELLRNQSGATITGVTQGTTLTTTGTTPPWRKIQPDNFIVSIVESPAGTFTATDDDGGTISWTEGGTSTGSTHISDVNASTVTSTPTANATISPVNGSYTLLDSQHGSTAAAIPLGSIFRLVTSATGVTPLAFQVFRVVERLTNGLVALPNTIGADYGDVRILTTEDLEFVSRDHILVDSDIEATGSAHFENLLTVGGNAFIEDDLDVDDIHLRGGLNFPDGTSQTTAGGSSSLNDLTDAVITTPTNNQILAYNGTDWVNAPAPVSTGGIVSSITTGVVNESRIIDLVASGVTTRIREGRADIIELSTSGGTVSGHQFAKLADEQVVLSSTDGDTILADNTGYDDGDPVGVNSTSLVQINAGTYDPITNPRGNLKEENISETSFVHHGALVETPFYDGEVRVTRDGSNVVSIEFGDEFNARDFLNRINLTRNNSTAQVVAGQTVTGDANSHLQVGRFYSQSGSGEVFTVYNAVDGFPGLRFQGANNDGIPSGVTSIRVTNSATLGDIVEGAVLITTDDGFLTATTSATDNSLDIGVGNQMLHMMIKTIGDTPTRLGTPISSGGVTVQYSLNSTTYYIDWNADRSSERLIASDRTTVLNIRTLTSNNI